ncbi:MAG: biopolymer transporter ExbD [Chitinophagales bacterium]|nr:biopolymer transporter ExbD [Chitinophagales bacterium]
MSRFRKKGKENPRISTASLPDVIFILLFFFMVVTVLREVTIKVEQRLPEATELTKLEKKSLVSTIYMGKPVPPYDQKLGSAPRIQLNDAFASVDDIPAFVESERNSTPEGMRAAMTFSLMVDRETKMGLVSDVKQELRKSDALKINYAAAMKGDE